MHAGPDRTENSSATITTRPDFCTDVECGHRDEDPARVVRRRYEMARARPTMVKKRQTRPGGADEISISLSQNDKCQSHYTGCSSHETSENLEKKKKDKKNEEEAEEDDDDDAEVEEKIRQQNTHRIIATNMGSAPIRHPRRISVLLITFKV